MVRLSPGGRLNGRVSKRNGFARWRNGPLPYHQGKNFQDELAQAIRELDAQGSE